MGVLSTTVLYVGWESYINYADTGCQKEKKKFVVVMCWNASYHLLCILRVCESYSDFISKQLYWLILNQQVVTLELEY